MVTIFKQINMIKYLDDFKRFFKAAFASMRGSIILDAIFVALLSVASSQVDKLLSPWTLLIVASVVVLVYFGIKRDGFLRHFPQSLIESVQKDVERKDLEIRIGDHEKERERNIIIQNAIAETIVGLNDHTCTLDAKIDSDEEVAGKLCDADVKEGLIKILTPFLSEIYTVVQSHTVKITLGVFFGELAQDWQVTGTAPTLPVLTIIKDENDMSAKIPANLMSLNTAGDLLTLKQNIDTCTQNNRYHTTEQMLFGEAYKIAFSTIPLACSDEKFSTGAIVVILKGASLPNDLERILRIFARILSNWEYKYNACMFNKSHEDPEMVNLADGRILRLHDNGRYDFVEPLEVDQEVPAS